MINDITIDTIDNCIDMLNPDVMGNLGREYFRGIYSSDQSGKITGALVWGYKYVQKPEKARSEIVFFRADTPEAAEELLNEYGGRISEYPVGYTYFELPELARDIRTVFESAGFDVREKEGRDVFLTVRELKDKKSFRKKAPSYIVSINRLSLIEFKKALSNCIFAGSTGMIDDLTMLPPSWYEQDISCAVKMDGKILGLFLVTKTTSGIIFPQLLFASGVDSKADLLYMLNYSVRKAADLYPSDTVVCIRRHDEKSASLVSYLFPEIKGKRIIAGARKESMGGGV